MLKMQLLRRANLRYSVTFCEAQIALGVFLDVIETIRPTKAHSDEFGFRRGEMLRDA
jgi:hypothetical protein